MYSENVLTGWLYHSIDASCLCIYSKGPLCHSIDTSYCMYSEDPLVTSYEARITVTTSDGFDSDLFPLSLHFEHSIIMNHLHSYVAVPGRNQTLFHHTFWLCYHTQCAVVHSLVPHGLGV